MNNVGSRQTSELGTALSSFRGAMVAIAVVSAVVNILYLTGSLYMLEVYDRVLPSRSTPTLIAISILAATLYVFQALLDFVRARVLIRIGGALDQAVGARVFDVLVRAPIRGRALGDGMQPLRDLDQIRSFFASGGPTALFDLPWLPFYIGICFLFHFWLGFAAFVGALILITVTLLNDIMTQAPSREAARIGAVRFSQAEASRRNAEVLHAMGMGGRLGTTWRKTNDDYIDTQQRLGDVAAGFGSLSKVLRMMLQSAVLGVGAVLVMRGEATAGIIIAGSILSARALAPAELAIANWKGFVAARQGWARLNQMLAALPPQDQRVSLPPPASHVTVESVTVAPPGSARPVLLEIQFKLTAGQGLGVIGPSAAGKSTLARALVGIWEPLRGKVRLDGAALDQWTPETLGPHVGYLPQNVELFEGTVAANIARCQSDAAPEKIIEAAKAAGIHEMILRLADGYDTQIGPDGAGLSAGQRQRIGLARALFGSPFLVVLDEPNSNLDADGDAALTRAIAGVRARGGIAVIVAHRPSALEAVDTILLLVNGRQQELGAKDVMLAKIVRGARGKAGADGQASGAGPRFVVDGKGEA